MYKVRSLYNGATQALVETKSHSMECGAVFLAELTDLLSDSIGDEISKLLKSAKTQTRGRTNLTSSELEQIMSTAKSGWTLVDRLYYDADLRRQLEALLDKVR